MNRRFVVSIPDTDYKPLTELAARQDRTVEQQAAHLLRQEISRARREPSAEPDPRLAPEPVS
jgi:hypothetical protein